MTGFRRVTLLLACGTLGGFVPSETAQACWCRRVYTGHSCDPCGDWPVLARRYYTPVYAPASGCPTPATTCCTPTNVERCCQEPQTTYTYQTRFEPQVSYVRRSYYDPTACCSRSYLEQSTDYVERTCRVPVTTWVRRCSTEPATPCGWAAASVWGSYYFMPGSSCWASDRCCHPVMACASAPCPLPCTSSVTPGETANPPAAESKKDESSTAPSPAPSPRPMPARPAGKKQETDKQGSSYQRMRVGRSGVVIVASPSGSQSANSTTGLRLAQTAR